MTKKVHTEQLCRELVVFSHRFVNQFGIGTPLIDCITKYIENIQKKDLITYLRKSPIPGKSLTLLAFIRDEIWDDVDQNVIYHYYFEAAKTEDPFSLLFFGTYLESFSEPEKVAKGTMLIKKAAELGNPAAQFDFSVLSYEGNTVNSTLLLKKAAAGGFESARSYYARRVSRGEGCNKDIHEAIKCMMQEYRREHIVEANFGLRILFSNQPLP